MLNQNNNDFAFKDLLLVLIKTTLPSTHKHSPNQFLKFSTLNFENQYLNTSCRKSF
ncbi:hypothetical protein HanPI659440_Chr01g0007251 [Helianthus annuus]|nr:hypothetical protein HanPI659440_Chr01g0007251 [Helianthus annuus]